MGAGPGRSALSDRERFFEAIAAHAGSAYLRYSFTKGTEQELAFLWDVLGLEAGMRVLDVGCGPGRHVGGLASLGIDVVGVDISVDFLRLVRGGAPVRADARSLPVASGSFDAVVSLCQGGFGLLGGDEDGMVLTELARAVRPGGRVAVSAFSSYFIVRYLEDGDTFDPATGVNHERTSVRNEAGEEREFDLWTTCFTPRELRLLAERAGLDVEALWSVAPGEYASRPPDLDHPEWLLVATPAPGSTIAAERRGRSPFPR
ncbi:MAG TPA: class I SAM-dependent methyltransferase [Acidimicrobiales bacterium]|nr:class I SAM-dependent methyltransferase [Acidimicrobiales bacterium]